MPSTAFSPPLNSRSRPWASMAGGITRSYFAQLRPPDRVRYPLMTLVRLSLAVVGCLLAFPAVAPARVIEIGRANEAEELPAPSCPRSPCFAVSRTTGYQAKVGTNRGLLRVPADGRIVAWTIRLSKPGPRQVQFFNERLGGPPAAGLSILRPGKRLFGRIVAQSPVVQLTDFLGQSVQSP